MYLTPEQAAKIASTHADTIRRWCQNGWCRHEMMGQQYAIKREWLDEAIANREENVRAVKHSPWRNDDDAPRKRHLSFEKAIAERQPAQDALLKRIRAMRG